jgi:cell division protein FtsB
MEEREKHLVNEELALKISLSALEQHRQAEKIQPAPEMDPGAMTELRDAAARIKSEIERLSDGAELSESCRRDLKAASKQLGLLIAVVPGNRPK